MLSAKISAKFVSQLVGTSGGPSEPTSTLESERVRRWSSARAVQRAMLECGDDDDVFEQADADAFEERAEAAAVERQVSVDPNDDALQAEATLTLEDFNLLPRVLQLLDAHQAGDGVDPALSELIRALNRCETGVERLTAEAAAEAATGARTEQRARHTLEARTQLLAQHRKRTHEELQQ